MSSREEQMAYYEKRVSEYPQGRLVRRLEDGRLRLYYEDGDFGFPVPEDLLHLLRSEIRDRKFFHREFLDKQREEPRARDAGTLYMGNDLRALAAPTAELQRRDCRAELEKYLYGDAKEAVCAMFGLRGTGKTTLMLQAIMDMTEEDFSRTAYYAADRRQQNYDVCSCLNSLCSQGVRFAFVDNITSLDDFVDAACVYENYKDKGMKVILSGPEPVCFHVARHNALFENLYLVHTTWMSFEEYARLTGRQDRDYYLEHGGVLYPSFEENDLWDYIERSVAVPVEHLLRTWKLGYRKGPAEDLIDADEFRPFLHRLVDKTAIDFLFSVIASLDALTLADREILHDAVLREYLRRNDEEYTEDNEDDLKGAEIWSLSYMEGMDFFRKDKDSDYETAVQPGIRYMLSRSMLEGAMKQEPFASCSQEARNELCGLVLKAVKDRMTQDLARYESTLAQ